MNDHRAPTRRRLLVAVLATSVAILPWLPIGPAGAAEVSAKSSVQARDPRGDVPYCKGDLLTADAEWTEARIWFQISTYCNMDTGSDPSWTIGASFVSVVIDVDGDGSPDYEALYDSETPGVLFDGSGRVVCNGTAQHLMGVSYQMEFAANCLPGPFTYAGVFVFDENPYGNDCTCPEDDSPDFPALAGPVNPPTRPAPTRHGQGYWMLGRDGKVYAFGDASVHGAAQPAGRAADLEPTPSGQGYWIVTEAGAVDVHGDAPFLGSIGAGVLRPSETVTAISRTTSGRGGYWLFTSLGRVFAFGDARFFGDMSSFKLNGPVLDAIPTPSGNGYYMVGSDGGIFTFGDAVFRGSMGSVPLNAPVQSLVPDPDGAGYWLVASDGGIFSFEGAFYGSMGSTKLNRPVTGMVGFGNGYLMVAEDGGIFSFGDAPFFGSLGDNPPAEPIVSTAILNQ
jgi:hypothetical protein